MKDIIAVDRVKKAAKRLEKACDSRDLPNPKANLTGPELGDLVRNLLASTLEKRPKG